MQESSDSAVETKIVALEKAWNQAYKMGDTRSLDSILDEHVILINDDGSTQTKSQFLASIKGPTSEEQQVAPESINVRVYGPTAIATGLFHAKGIENGKHYNRYDRFVDTWMFKDGKWVCVATNATPVLH
jgi:ketosteroid isomerase-like protein